MLQTTLLLSLVIIHATLGCTPPYNTWIDGNCYYSYSSYTTISWPAAAENCKGRDATLASIHGSQENADFLKLAKEDTLQETKRGYWIGLRCDGKKFYWEDGSFVDYTNFGDSTYKCNTTSTDLHFYMNWDDGKWYRDVNWDWYGRAYVCKKNYRPEDSICEEYELVSDTKTCLSLRSDSMDSKDAENSCTYTGGHLAAIHDNTVNDYIRRSAVSNNLLNGVLIGLKQSGNDLTWNDNTTVNYTNFAKNFPNSSLGSCFAMQTSSLAGEWVNVQCGGTSATPTKLPYACTMPAYDLPDEMETSECPIDTYYSDGDMIYSPSFPSPNNTNSCEYLIVGPEGAKNMQVEVVFFETNRCCDSLTIYEGIAGAQKIATLAGSTYNGNIYKSANGPAMRLVYNVQSGAHVRGWQLKVKAIK
ncbi:hypothetical protein PRIPAC_77555 [Pristionchus pacificus]|uniref:C-type lectin n=1 Tax=Pristionchus pacificus TaxID=54126 RepID=A0A454XWH7_PRIPA|nr:hypothetical protein PRIPAC_77555 [Pristionchus pacificus]|eukprot:PDM65526.1 C-type lectin [Pristionchus pacificus]